MLKFLVPLICLLLCSCSTVQRKAPRFDKPSTVPVHQAADNAGKKIAAAQSDAKKLETDCPQSKAIILSLQQNLAEAASEMFSLKGSLASLDIQLEQQTTKANGLADDYDKAGAQITSLRESRHKWVKMTWYLGLALLGALVWIFKGPLLRIARGAMGIPF